MHANLACDSIPTTSISALIPSSPDRLKFKAGHISICAAMLSPAELKHISRACSQREGGMSGIVFDYDHLKFLHLSVPYRNIVSYMTAKQMCRFPICFLKDTPDCHCVKHKRDDFDVAVTRHLRGVRDKHRWITKSELAAAFGINELADTIAPAHAHDVEQQKLNNLRAILDPTSATKHRLLSQHPQRDMTEALFFILATTIYLNEGHYILTFLHL